MTIAAAYRQLVESLSTCYPASEAASIARIVLEDAFGIRNYGREDELAPAQRHRLAQLEALLLNLEPVQYVLGVADFYGLKFKVTPAVLIPRAETEELVHWILEDGAPGGSSAAPSLLDIGTGSGCIPVTIKKKRPRWQTTGIDVSTEALAIARENAVQNGVAVDWRQVDILDRAQWQLLGNYQIIVSNPPYIPLRESHLLSANVRAYEPSLALFVEDDDPLLFYRSIAAFAIRHLASGGFLYFELNEFNAEEVLAMLQTPPFRSAELRHDLQGKPRMIKALV